MCPRVVLAGPLIRSPRECTPLTIGPLFPSPSPRLHCLLPLPKHLYPDLLVPSLPPSWITPPPAIRLLIPAHPIPTPQERRHSPLSDQSPCQILPTISRMRNIALPPLTLITLMSRIYPIPESSIFHPYPQLQVLLAQVRVGRAATPTAIARAGTSLQPIATLPLKGCSNFLKHTRNTLNRQMVRVVLTRIRILPGRTFKVNLNPLKIISRQDTATKPTRMGTT